MDELAIVTVLVMLILAVTAALILISVFVPRGFNNYQIRAPKVYKRRSNKKYYGRK